MNKKIPIKTKPDNTEDASIAAMALSKQNAGQYKEAIELYKQLLKRADNKAWRQALAQCYLQRALSFAEKGMVKEAVVLWDNYAESAESPYQGYDCYIAWLFQINNTAKVKTCLSRLSAQQLDEYYPDLAGLLGLLIITEKPELDVMLPKDSAFIIHLGFVRAALKAYQNNKLEELEQALKQLPFRSAFRDFRTLLKAALSLPDSAEQAQSLLTKIPAASPYYQSAQLLLAATHNGSVLVNDLLQLDFKQRQIIGTVKEFSKKQFELLETLLKQKDHLSDKVRFNSAIQYRELFGLDLAKAYCRAILITYPAGQRDFNKHFGGIDEFEQFRLKALQHERDRDYDSAEYYWKQGITLLKKQGAPAAFKIALIMRHIAAHKQTPREAMQWLVDSLEHDPGDRDSYLKILQYYEHPQQQADDYKQWLDKAIKAFPNDIDMLVLVIKAALANKAFKKATQYAQAILKIDPVNTFAKQVLFTSHLAHARKLIKTKKFHLVEKEIQQAEKLNIGKRYQTQAQLMRGFFVFMTEDKKQGLQQIADAMQKMNEGSLCAHFCIVMETLLMGLTLAPILKALPAPAKNYQLSEQELTRLVQLVQQYHSNDKGNQTVLHKALEKIKAIIKQSVKQQKYSEETLLMLCQCLDSIGHFELLRHCAKIALPRWVKPIWVFYKTYAEANGQADQCSNFEIIRLKYQLGEAHKQSDDRTVMLIAKFIDQYYKAHNPLGSGFFGDDFDDDDDFDEEDASSIDLFDHLPEELFNKIQKKMEEIMRRNPPDRVINAISKLASKKLDVSFILTNPDTFWGLLALHAASELGIDTGVSADEVLSFSQEEAGSKSSSFPFF
ncbi:MAG: hypothetical protein QX199_00670 [Methylococcaceae bacterium]